MFLLVSDAPPFEKGTTWSKWRFVDAPHSTHLPPSRFQTSSLMLLGMIRRCCDCAATGEVSSISWIARILNLHTTIAGSFCPAINQKEDTVVRPNPVLNFLVHAHLTWLCTFCFVALGGFKEEAILS